MQTRSATVRGGLGLATIGGLLAVMAGPADAVVTQPAPDGTVMPQPTTSTEISVVVSRGFSADADTLSGLFKSFANGADAKLDPVNDAATAPGSFPAQCGFRAQIVLKGGACKNAFGWYNATEPATIPSAIYPLVSAALMAAPPNGIGCSDNGFCPLATRTTSQAPQHAWADPLPEFDVDLESNANWAGGPVGFALIGTAGSTCSETKYSQAELSDKSPSGAPWVTALIYHSVADAGAYYLAFEDSPTCAASWRGCISGGSSANPPGTGNDGDFNDDVFYVSGLNCSLAGTTDAGAASSGAAGAGGAPAAGGTTGTAGATGAGGGAQSATGGTTGGAGTAGAGGATSATGGTTGTTGIGGATTSATGGTTGTAGTTGSAGASGTTGASGAGGATGSGGKLGAGGVVGSAGSSGGATLSGAGNSGCGCDLAGPAPVFSFWASVWFGLQIARYRRRGRIATRQ